MYNITKVSHINNDIYNIKIQLDKKEQLIKKYGLKEVGEYKEYWINNVQIISNGDTFDFNYFEDIYIEYDDTKKISKYQIVPSPEWHAIRSSPKLSIDQTLAKLSLKASGSVTDGSTAGNLGVP